MRGKDDAYVDVVAQELKGKSGSLATDVAVCYVRLDAQNTTRIRVGCSHDWVEGERSKLRYSTSKLRVSSFGPNHVTRTRRGWSAPLRAAPSFFAFSTVPCMTG